jgi:L-2,4-diaminobutyric acid acetyltransferase
MLWRGSSTYYRGIVPVNSSFLETLALESSVITFRTACEADAAIICELAAGTGILEANSCYCYLLLCRDFADTCLVAQRDDKTIGFVTAYRPPQRQDTIFVWQIGVAEQSRRQGLAKRMLRVLLSLPACREVQFLEATVTPSNQPSKKLFESFANELEIAHQYQSGFTKEMFGHGDHEEEQLFRMGPWSHGAMVE